MPFDPGVSKASLLASSDQVADREHYEGTSRPAHVHHPVSLTVWPSDDSDDRSSWNGDRAELDDADARECCVRGNSSWALSPMPLRGLR